jgi:pantoate--beta-alanine ligase
MQVIERIEGIREQVDAWRRAAERVALVPTMGNLHEGHLALVDEARAQADRVVVSVFVNPTQFGPNEDYDAYPRTLDADADAVAGRGADAVFAPTVATMYPAGGSLDTRVEVPSLTDRFCGIARPGHFTGVATVVCKLLNIARPDVAVFGRKDYQQLLVIQRLVADLNMPVTIRGAPIVREADGLAMSSRNNYLTDDERRRAPALYRALQQAGTRLGNGEAGPRDVEAEAWRALADAGLEPEYFTVADPETLEPAAAGEGALVILAAAWLGRARLIDNHELALDGEES